MILAIFTKVLGMSLTASFVIGVVLLVRFLLKDSPKIFSYALWAVVLLRLLCPVSVVSPVSLVPREFQGDILTVQPEAPGQIDEFAEENIQPAGVKPGTSDISAPVVEGTNQPDTVLPIVCGIWLMGLGGIWLYSAWSYFRLRQKLSDAVPLRDNIYLSDRIPSPCVTGMLRHRIYLPAALQAEEQPYIIAHEQHHIRRGDPLARFLAFAALSIHWFNPLVWLSFHLLVKDMEMSCDEAVLRRLGPDIRSDYSQSLLNLAVGRTNVAWTPLTFGETDTAARIKNVLRWRKPATWTVVLAVVLSVSASVCALTDPAAESPGGAAASDVPIQVEELVLNESQQKALERLLAEVTLEEGDAAYQADIRNLFMVEARKDGVPCSIFYGYYRGESYVTIVKQGADTACLVENETLEQYLYHFYICGGAIDMHFTELPEGGKLYSDHHAKGCEVRLYEYPCDLCGQWETAVVSYYCGCPDCRRFWNTEAQKILE